MRVKDWTWMIGSWHWIFIEDEFHDNQDWFHDIETMIILSS